MAAPSPLMCQRLMPWPRGMSERRGGLYRFLENPRIYEWLQGMTGADEARRRFATDDIRARPGDRVLDIGCGPAQILKYLPGVDYVGWEPNAEYVRKARAMFGTRGTFHIGHFGSLDAQDLAPVDIAIVSAVLHHLDDGQATDLFRALRMVVKDGGRVVTIDNVYSEGQNPVAKALIALDRGRHVRTAEGYQALALRSFASAEGRIVHRRFPPYTHFIMTAS